ncbi:GNAT family N-acetyltransferase, partial [Streptococcus oralis]|uniref:GNAT family N-acetyltransferase n=1 Tax=Streptococcus oralis TaxID=1303 RepID=UPI00077D8F79
MSRKKCFKIEKIQTIEDIDGIVKLHLDTFEGFFLTFLGEKFLRELYKGFLVHKESDVLLARNSEGKIVGFLAYSSDLSDLYRFLIKTDILKFALYSLKAVVLRPKIILKLFRALGAPRRAEEKDKYIKVSSLAVAKSVGNQGVGSQLLSEIKDRY